MIRMVPALLALSPLSVRSAPGNFERHIPRGEEIPQIVEKVFDSPVGEVEFTQIGPRGHSGFLRNAKGNLLGFTEVRGNKDCEEWFLSSKEAAVPRNCEFVFFDENEGRYLSVRSDEIEETTLFQVAHGKLRSWKIGAEGVSGGHNVAL